MTTTTLHQRIKLAMREHHMTQTELALAMHVSVTDISHLLRGDRTPSYRTLCKLLRALPAVDVRWLLLG